MRKGVLFVKARKLRRDEIVGASHSRDWRIGIELDHSFRKAGRFVSFKNEGEFASILIEQGVNVQGLAFDTLLAAYVLNPDRASNKLGSLAGEFLGLRVSEYADVAGKDGDFRDVAVADATHYAAEDAHIAWLLSKTFEPMLSENGLEQVFYEIEMPLLPVLIELERNGVRLDVARLSEMSEDIGSRLEILKKELFDRYPV